MRLIAVLPLLTLSFACSQHSATTNGSTQAEQSDEPYTANQPATELQVIVGFQATARDPEDPSLVMEMSKLLNADMAFIRRISGNAAVYLCTSTQSKSELVKKLQQLKQHDDIRYGEPDRMMKTQ